MGAETKVGRAAPGWQDNRAARTRAHRRPRGSAGLLLVLFLSGCGIFDTRTPETPEGEEVPFENPDEQSIVLTNIEVTLEAKRTINYGRSLVEEGFSYEPAPGDVQDFNARYPTYGRQEEMQAIGAVLTVEGELDLVWGDPGQPRQGENENETFFDDLTYEIVFTQADRSITYSGICDMYFREDLNGLFSIFRVEDNEDGSGRPTWTRLRIRGAGVFPEGGP